MVSIPIIAVLLTCHNRKDKTLQCLQALYAQQSLSIDYQIEVFLVDDGSTDGTSAAIAQQFPLIHIISGDGNLYWNRGMHKAWETAASTKDFDYYLWLNDDTILDNDAVVNLIDTFNEVLVIEKKDIVITSACREKIDNNIFSYGGRTDKGPVYPNGFLQECKYINGNAVFVPKGIYKELGNLSKDYTHSLGDVDYGLRALKFGFKCYTTKQYLATCPPNEGVPGWCNPEVPLKKRWVLFHSPRGLNIKEYVIFRKRFWGIKWISYTIKAYLKMISPKFYTKNRQLIKKDNLIVDDGL